ncbi:MAG: LicD family protein, partial [Roseiarcus sp.]
YIHEKFRRRGGRALCLPFLRWMHRFNRPLGTPYANQWEDRVRNYLIGFRELGWDTAPVVDHFKTFLGEQIWQRVTELLEEGVLSPDAAHADAGRTSYVDASQQSLQPVLELTPLEPASATNPGTAVIGDPFASVWDDTSLAQQRRLLQRTLAIAESRKIALYLYWGTLLGHVREAGILPWDDDVDFALFDPGQAAELCAAFQADGLKTHDLRSASETWIKVFDPTYAVTPYPLCPWTWPCIDIFIYSMDPKTANGSCPVVAYPHDLILPGRVTMFEGARCWEPEQPLAVLDLQYGDWRNCEVSPHYSHRSEQLNAGQSTRRIVTDVHGQKIRQG